MRAFEFDLFEFYRLLLALLAGTYSLVRLCTFAWQWLGPTGAARLGSPVLYRYFVTLLLRMRLRRFVFELSVLAMLSAVFVLLVTQHWW